MDQAMTFKNADWNFSISSGVPIVTRTWFGQLGQTHPINTLCLRMALITFSPGCRTSTMKSV